MMKFRKFAVAFALILVGIALFAATACAAPSVQAEYRIRVDLQNGEPNYDSVYFHGAFFGVHGVEANKNVILTIMGGDYYFSDLVSHPDSTWTRGVPWGTERPYDTKYLDGGNGSGHYTRQSSEIMRSTTPTRRRSSCSRGILPPIFRKRDFPSRLTMPPPSPDNCR